jgi:hypothetical protein
MPQSGFVLCYCKFAVRNDRVLPQTKLDSSLIDKHVQRRRVIKLLYVLHVP